MEKGFWFEVEGHDVAGAIHSTIKRLDRSQEALLDRFLQYINIYTNRGYTGLGNNCSYAKDSSLQADVLVHNVAKNLVDTATSKISTKKVKVMCLTEGGKPSIQKKAKLLNKFVAGQFFITDIYKKARLAFRD